MTEQHKGLEKSPFPVPDSVIKLSVDRFGYPDKKGSAKDYFAKDSQDVAEKSKREETLKLEEHAAKNALESYEAMELQEDADLYKAEDLFAEASAAIAGYEDSDGRRPLLERLATKKAALDQEKKAWGALSLSREEYDAQILEQNEKKEAAQRKKAAEEAAYRSAEKRFKKLLGYLYEFEYQTPRADKILKQAKSILDTDLSGSGSYEELKGDYEDALSYVKKLPTEDEYDRRAFKSTGSAGSLKEDDAAEEEEGEEDESEEEEEEVLP